MNLGIGNQQYCEDEEDYEKWIQEEQEDIRKRRQGRKDKEDHQTRPINKNKNKKEERSCCSALG